MLHEGEGENTLRLSFVSENNVSEMEIRYGVNDPNVIELLSIFGSFQGGQYQIEQPQQVTSSLKERISEFVECKYGRAPELQRLKSFFSKLDDGGAFLFFPFSYSSLSSKEKVECENFLHKVNKPDAINDDELHQKLFGKLLDEYNITIPRIDKNTAIGAKRKEDRKCRFCGKTKANGAKFKSKAHAIPQALGNAYLKLNDECDNCNNYFGRNVEPHLLNWLNIQRVFLDIRNGDNKPKITTPYGEIYNDGKQMVIQTKSVLEKENGVLEASLGSFGMIVPIKIYQGLVKIALSVVPNEELQHLKKTIEWVRDDKYIDENLPTVASTIVNFPKKSSAQITLYIRKSEQGTLPHIVGELTLGCYLYVFVLPFSNRDNWDLIGYFDKPDFKETFLHYMQKDDWGFDKLDISQEVDFQPKIKAFPRKTERK